MKRQPAAEAPEGEIELSQLVLALVVEVPDAVTEVERDELRHPKTADRAHRPAELGPGPEAPDVASDVDPEFLRQIAAEPEPHDGVGEAAVDVRERAFVDGESSRAGDPADSSENVEGGHDLVADVSRD